MIPETKISLILRLADRDDHEAWQHFETVYRPVVYKTARGKGLQDADAEDVVQQVMASVARALEKRPHDKQRAKFRTWLYRVTHNAIINAIQRRKPDRGAGDTHVLDQLKQVPLSMAESQMMDSAYQRSVFQWAAERIKAEFQEDTWQAFWITMVDNVSCEAAAEQLGKQIGSIYAARSRVVRRLKQKIQEFDDTCQVSGSDG